MNKITIRIATEEEDMKQHFTELLKEMMAHDEIVTFIITEEKGSVEA